MTRKLPSNNHNADILDRPIQNKTKLKTNDISCTVNPKTSYMTVVTGKATTVY